MARSLIALLLAAAAACGTAAEAVPPLIDGGCECACPADAGVADALADVLDARPDAAPAGVPLGHPCAPDDACAPGLVCEAPPFLRGLEPICTRSCAARADCPGGMCLGRGGDTMRCLLSCPCPAPMECLPVGAADGVCVIRVGGGPRPRGSQTKSARA